RGLGLQHPYQSVQSSRLCRPRTDPQAEAAASSPGDTQAAWPDRRARHDPCSDADVLQERARQDRAWPGEGEASARQARDHQAARGRSGDAGGSERTAEIGINWDAFPAAWQGVVRYERKSRGFDLDRRPDSRYRRLVAVQTQQPGAID